MKFNLRFTSEEALWPVVATTADLHCLTLHVLERHRRVTEWNIETELTAVDLCNFVNDLGAAGVQAVCSELR